MSFRSGVDDVVALSKLVDKVRKDFSGAPGQFQCLSDELKSLSAVLQDIDVAIAEADLNAQRQSGLQQALSTCQSVLEDVEAIRDKFSGMGPSQAGSKTPRRRVWIRLKWEPGEARELCDRISSSVTILTTFLVDLSE
ncbi:hypothetical protein ACJZ2D_010183 [Fusarium nematophilum]